MLGISVCFDTRHTKVDERIDLPAVPGSLDRLKSKEDAKKINRGGASPASLSTESQSRRASVFDSKHLGVKLFLHQLVMSFSVSHSRHGEAIL
jgi:hypothetical protein